MILQAPQKPHILLHAGILHRDGKDIRLHEIVGGNGTWNGSDHSLQSRVHEKFVFPDLSVTDWKAQVAGTPYQPHKDTDVIASVVIANGRSRVALSCGMKDVASKASKAMTMPIRCCSAVSEHIGYA
jgi:hypothetical protein